MGKHLNLSQRIIIEGKLNEGFSLRKIGDFIGKPHTTISREIISRRVLVKGNHFNNFNTKCNKTEKSPFVCNGCPNKSKCRKNKYFYYAKDANDNYRKILSESREGIDFESSEFRMMDKTITEEINLGHSFYMIVQDHPEFDITERTLYYYQEKGYLSCKNIDLPRKVRYRKRKRAVSKNKSDRKETTCRIGRTYQDFLTYKEANKLEYYVEMDTVEGIKGHSVLLTLCFIPFNFMIAFKLDSQTIPEVTDKMNSVKKILGFELFHKIFPVILTDNGKEFKRPDLIEDNGNDVVNTKVFFCDSRRSDQKGSIEVTHEYIRKYIEQGKDLDSYSQEQIDLMMNHINNTKRKKLDGNSPYSLMIKKFGIEPINKLGFYFIESKDIILNPNLFKDNNK
jgi:IS30 family transposase